MLYGKDEKIHAILVDNELEEESENLLNEGWSQNEKTEVKIESLQIGGISGGFDETDNEMYSAIEAEQMNLESIQNLAVLHV